jgi:Zn-dependent alcohol dehydrogenase
VNALAVVQRDQDGPLHLEPVHLPEPGPHEIVVREHASGICHTQLDHMRRPRSAPMLLGHEATGTVIGVGDSVSRLQIGDRVILTWLPRHPNYGRPPSHPSVTLVDGTPATVSTLFTWAETTVVDEMYAVALPAESPTDVTSIVGCAVMTGAGAVIRTAGVRPGDSVAIFGAGGIGLAAVGAAAAVGADPIIVVDIEPAKLELATGFGATHVIDASNTDAVARIHELTTASDRMRPDSQPVGGVDVAFDCAGTSVTAAALVHAVRPGEYGGKRGGSAVLVGFPTEPVPLDLAALNRGQRTYVGTVGGSCQPERDFPVFLNWHASGRLDLEALVTDRFTLEEIDEAVTALRAGAIRGRAIIEFDR